jgi:hypothetical protein
MNQLRPCLKSYILQLVKDGSQKKLGCLQISSISTNPPSYILSDQKHRIKAYLTPLATETFDANYGATAAWSTKRGALIKLSAFQLQYDTNGFFLVLDNLSVLGAEEANEFGSPIELMEDLEVLQIFHRLIRIDSPQQSKLVLADFSTSELQPAADEQSRQLRQFQIWHKTAFLKQSSSDDFDSGSQEQNGKPSILLHFLLYIMLILVNFYNFFVISYQLKLYLFVVIVF